MLCLRCHFLSPDASRIIVAPSVKWIIRDFSCFHLFFLGSDELRSVFVSLSIYPLYADFCKQLLLWVKCKKKKKKIWMMILFIRVLLLPFRWRKIAHSSKWFTFLPETNECEELHRDDWVCFATTSCAACGCWKVESEGDFKGRKFSFRLTVCLFLKLSSLLSVLTTTGGFFDCLTWSDTIIIYFLGFLFVSWWKHHTVLILCLSEQRN